MTPRIWVAPFDDCEMCRNQATFYCKRCSNGEFFKEIVEELGLEDGLEYLRGATFSDE